MTNEQRLEQLRDQAWDKGVVSGRGVNVSGGPIPGRPGYYGEAVIKPPAWTWEIPLYLLVGGFSGMAAVIALVGLIFHQSDLARTAMLLAAIGAIVSPILLIMDLGRPRLFLNMLRVFKYQSPMSVGAWIVFVFGGCAVPGLVALELHAHQIFIGGFNQFLQVIAFILVLGSAAALLELLGHRMAPLAALGFLAAGIEAILWIWLEVDKHGNADRALHQSHSGWLIRSGEILSGPLALILRLTNFVPFAAISFLLGALISRFGWIWAGKVCARDPEAVFASQR